jgi:hypothetical protein
VKGSHAITTEDILQYFGMRIFMHGKHKKTLKKTFQLLRKEFGDIMAMAHRRFERIQRAWLCPQAVKILNHASSKVILNTEVITIDEKLKPYRGESPYLRFVPNKDPPKGHWITEVTVNAPNTRLPFLVHSIPVQTKEGPTMVEMFQNSLEWVAEEQRSKTVVVSDAYYMDDATRLWLRDSGLMYLAAINPTTRFREVWEPLKKKVKKCGQAVVAWNKTTGEAAVHCWTFENRKTFLLTNAFTFKKGPAKITSHIFDTAYIRQPLILVTG